MSVVAPSDMRVWPTLSSDAYYGLAGEIVRTIEPHSEADPVGLLVQELIMFGNIVGSLRPQGRDPHFIVEKTRHGMNTFGVLVGKTAKARKGSSWAHIQDIGEAVDREWAHTRVLSGLSSGEGLIWAVRDDLVTSAGREPGIADKRLLVFESEFASTLKVMRREESTLSTTIRQAWDSGNLQTLTKHSPAKARGAHISIIGHITEDELRRYLDTTEVASGFANRFLWVSVKRSKFLPDGGDLQPGDLEPCVKRLAQAVEFAKRIDRLRRDDEAREVWHAAYPTLSEEQPGLFGAIVSRAEAQVTRLSCLYALQDLSPVVKAVHLKAALALWRYCEDSVGYIFGDKLGDPTADSILQAIREKPGMTRTDINNLFARNKSADEIGRGLALLVKYGRARPEQAKTTGGKSVESWYPLNAHEVFRHGG